MKQLSDLKIGILIGLIASCAIIAYKPVTEYYASANNEITKEAAAVDSIEKAKDIDYEEVFSAGDYEDLYLLVYYTALVNPENEALKIVASAYGFTPAEAQSVLDGSIEPLMTKYGDIETTQQGIYNKSLQFVEDFMDLYETLALEQELTIGGVASEIFSNGDISDSGFDLVYDLTIIEEIIFGTKTDATLGGPLDFSGINDKEEDTDELIASGNSDSKPNIPDVYSELDKTDESAIDTNENIDTLSSFDPNSLVQIQENDICPKPETKIEIALDDFKESNPTNIGLADPTVTIEPKNIKPKISQEAAKTAADNPDSLSGVLIPEPPDDWSDKPACNGFFYSLKGGTEEGRLTQDMTGQDGPETIAGKSDEQAGNGSKSNISAEFFICLEATTKWAKYGTVVADRPCIKCETEKILAYLNKTLENSFVPNKVTGNFLEPSKCKSAFSSAIDIKFSLIWSPVQTPRKDDSNKLKSLRGEWDKLTSRSNPLILQDIPMSILGDNINATALSTAQQNSPEGATYSQLMEQVNVIKDTFAKQAAEGSDLFSTISSGENFVTYSQDVMKEVDQMTNYFLNFKNILTKLANETCPSILSKPKVK